MKACRHPGLLALALSLLLSTATVCASTATLFMTGEYYIRERKAMLYSGTRLDFAIMTGKGNSAWLNEDELFWWSIVDTPLSLIFDTLLLPFTLPQSIWALFAEKED